MRLRAEINKPNRYHEDRDLVPYATSSSHPTMNKDTIPAYPDIHGRSTANGAKKLMPAAFPSLPFKRRRDSAGKAFENHVAAEMDHASIHSRLFMSPRRQNGLLQNPTSPKNPKKTTNAEDVEMTNEELPDQCVIDDMRTSPILLPADLPDASEESQASWDGIEVALQIYIFDNLLQQFVYPDIVAEVLGLDSSDLVKLAHIKNGRVLRAETTEELWNYCRSLGDGTKSFIDPQVLRRYMDYFAYVSRFEDASVFQRRTAVVFLRQRKIEGAFVEALLRDETGMWTRPDYREKHPSHDATNSTVFTYDGEADWGSILSRTPVHESHNLDLVATRFRSFYLPSVVRNNLLAKPLEDLNGFEKWLMYGSVPSTTTGAESAEEPLVGKSSRLGEVLNTVPRGLSISLRRQIQEGDHVSLEDSGKTTSKLYTIAKTTHQSRLLREKIEQMPLSRQQKSRILNVAEEHAESMLVKTLGSPTPEVSEHSPTGASIPASPSSEQSETSTQPSRSTNAGLQSSFSSDLASSLSPNIRQGYSSATSPEPERTGHYPVDKETTPMQRTDKNRSNTLSTDATLVLKNQEAAYRAHNLPHDNDAERSQYYDTSRHARAVSQESYHTAPDHDDSNTGVSTTSRQFNRRSLSPPLWSPITDGDGEMHQVSSLSAQVSAQAVTNPDLPLSKNLAFRRATPWKSTIASSRNSPTASRGHKVQQQNNVHISQPMLEMLSGIHEAATSPTPSPMIPHSSKALSTNLNRQPSHSKLPIPSLVPSLDQRTSPSKTQKKKQKNTLTPTAPSQPGPQKAKVNLKLRMPVLIAADSSTSGDSPPSSPTKKIRSDKGKKRGLYMTKKAKLAIEAKAQAEANADGKAETQPQAEPDQEIKGVEQKESDVGGQAHVPFEPPTKEVEGITEQS